MRLRRLLLALLFALLLALAACVAPARNYEDYQGKAVSTAEEALSAVRTGILVIEGLRETPGHLPYVDVVVTGAEADATTTMQQFESVQPPGRRSDQLRDELHSLLQPAVDKLTEMRIAVRRSDWPKAREDARALRELADKLEAFFEAHDK